MHAKPIIGLTIAGASLLAALAFYESSPAHMEERVMHAQYTSQVANGLAHQLEAVIRDGEAAIVWSRHAMDGRRGESTWRLSEGSTFRDPMDHHFNTVYRVTRIDGRGVLLAYHHRSNFPDPVGREGNGSDYGLILVPYFVCWKTYAPLHALTSNWQLVVRSHESFLPCVPDILIRGPGFGVLSGYALPPAGG